MSEVVIGRWGNEIDFSDINIALARKQVRVESKSVRAIKVKGYRLISTNGPIIVDQYGQHPIGKFFGDFVPDAMRPLLVLTFKEKQLLVDHLPDLQYLDFVEVFEQIYPIFKSIYYTPDPDKNFQLLGKLFDKAKVYAPKGIPLATYLVAKHHRHLVNKVPLKNGFDQYFALADQSAYQEVFKLSEERRDRKIIALDFNSMFPSCLEGKFADPATVRHQRMDQLYSKDVKLDQGMYHVILKGPTDRFFKSYHYFSHCVLGKKHLFRCSDDGSIRTLLFRNEIQSLAPLFSEVYLIEGFVSSKEIYHPLYNKAQTLYKKRKGVGRETNLNEELNGFYKFCLVSLHTVSAPKKDQVIRFQSFDEVRNYLDKEFGFNCKTVPSRFVLNALSLASRFDFRRKGKYYELRVPCLSHSQAIYSLSSQVLATARLRMFNMLNTLESYPTVEICYANVDSVHLSIDSNKVDDFLNQFADQISGEMGRLKIQCIADRGYWFDVGRYWLFEGDEVVQYKNILFNQSRHKALFCRKRLVRRIVKNGNFSYVRKATRKLENAFSYTKRVADGHDIDHCDYQRYDFSEVYDLFVAGDTVDSEILRSKTKKIQLFDRIAT